jgi:hypothetical protein
MQTPAQWRRKPRPNSDVIQALEQALHAARNGGIRSIVIVTCDPLKEVETASAGDLSKAARASLIGALVMAAHELTRTSPPK